MVTHLDNAGIRVSVEERIKAAYLNRQVAVFFPDQFTRAGLGSLNDVVEVLKSLVKDHWLSEDATVKCAFGHARWHGDPRDIAPSHVLERECPIAACPSHELDDDERDDEENQGFVVLAYRMTKPWKEKLDASKKAVLGTGAQA